MGLISNCKKLSKLNQLVCPCGAPLELFQADLGVPTAMRVWCVGHANCDQSPIIHGSSLSEVFSLLVRNIKVYGSPVPTRQDYLNETNRSMLEYDRSDAASKVEYPHQCELP